MDIQLTKHFHFKEFFKNEDELNYYLNLDPKTKEYILNNLKSLTQKLQLFRDYKGIKIFITSGFRSLVLNKSVGGAKNSYHLSGSAVDITYKDIKKTADKDFQQLKVIFNGLLYYNSQSFFHCDIRQEKYQLFNYK